MAGSPKKREREKAARLLAAEQNQETAGGVVAQTPVPPLVPYQDVIAPVAPVDVTRTAQKRAMRAKAQEYAADAMAVLKDALESPDERVRVAAANDLLAWGFGKPAQEIEAGDGAQIIQIIRFGEQQ